MPDQITELPIPVRRMSAAADKLVRGLEMSSSERAEIRNLINAALQSDLDGKAPADVVTSYIDGTNSLAIASGVVAVDAANGRSQKLTLTEDVTEFQAPTNLADGQSMVITGKQDATGERAFNLASSGYVLVGGEEADISALTSNQRFLLSIIRDGGDYLVTLATQ